MSGLNSQSVTYCIARGKSKAHDSVVLAWALTSHGHRPQAGSPRGSSHHGGRDVVPKRPGKIGKKINSASRIGIHAIALPILRERQSAKNIQVFYWIFG